MSDHGSFLADSTSRFGGCSCFTSFDYRCCSNSVSLKKIDNKSCSASKDFNIICLISGRYLAMSHTVCYLLKSSTQICELCCDIRVFNNSAPNEECGEIPVAFVVRRQETTLSEQDVINYVAAQVRVCDSKGF